MEAEFNLLPPASPASASKPPPPEVFLALGILIGTLAVCAIAVQISRNMERRGKVIFLPDHPVFRHCPCGYPARSRPDLAQHLQEMHPHMSPEQRFEIVWPEPTQGAE